MIAKFLPEEFGGDLMEILKALQESPENFHSKLVEMRNTFEALLELDYVAGIGNRTAESWHNPDIAEAGPDIAGRPDQKRQDYAEGPAPGDLAPQVSNRPGAHSGFEAEVSSAMDAAGLERSAVLPQMAQG